MVSPEGIQSSPGKREKDGNEGDDLLLQKGAILGVVKFQPVLPPRLRSERATRAGGDCWVPM